MRLHWFALSSDDDISRDTCCGCVSGDNANVIMEMVEWYD